MPKLKKTPPYNYCQLEQFAKPHLAKKIE